MPEPLGQHHVTAEESLPDRLEKHLQEFMEEERQIDSRRAWLLDLVLRPSGHPVGDDEYERRLNIGFALGAYEYRINVDIGNDRPFPTERSKDLDSRPRVLATRVGGDMRSFVSSLPTDEQLLLIQLLAPQYHVEGLDGGKRVIDPSGANGRRRSVTRGKAGLGLPLKNAGTRPHKLSPVSPTG